MFLFQMSSKKVVSDKVLKKFLKNTRKNQTIADENHQNVTEQCTGETILFEDSVFPKNVRQGIAKFTNDDKNTIPGNVEPKARVGLSSQPVSVSIPVAFCVIQLYSVLLCFARHLI